MHNYALLMGLGVAKHTWFLVSFVDVLFLCESFGSEGTNT